MLLPLHLNLQRDTGGHFGWYRKYKHPNESKKKRKPIGEEVREMYEAMIEVAPVAELVKIHAVVEDFTKKGEKPSVKSASVIRPPQINWVRLAKDLENVYELARIYDRMLAEDEEEAGFMVLM